MHMMGGNCMHVERYLTSNEVEFAKAFIQKYRATQSIETRKGIIYVPEPREHSKGLLKIKEKIWRVMLKPTTAKGIKRRKIAQMLQEHKWTYQQIMAAVPCASATLWSVKNALKDGIYFAPIDWRPDVYGTTPARTP